MTVPRTRSTRQSFERCFDAAGQGAVAFNRKFIDITQRNVNSAFDLAKSLAGAKNVSEMVPLQTAYWQKLLNTMTSQAEEVRALMTKVAVTTGEPVTERVSRGVDELRKATSDLPDSHAPDGHGHRIRRRTVVKGLMAILTIVFVVGHAAPVPKDQLACERAGMKWDSTASAPKVKCNAGYA